MTKKFPGLRGAAPCDIGQRKRKHRLHHRLKSVINSPSTRAIMSYEREAIAKNAKLMQSVARSGVWHKSFNRYIQREEKRIQEERSRGYIYIPCSIIKFSQRTTINISEKKGRKKKERSTTERCIARR